MPTTSCDYCDGKVHEKVVKQEVFRHKAGFVILEDVPVGVCDRCGTRYHGISVLKRVAAIATGKERAKRTQAVPVG